MRTYLEVHTESPCALGKFSRQGRTVDLVRRVPEDGDNGCDYARVFERIRHRVRKRRVVEAEGTIDAYGCSEELLFVVHEA
jgi:hypothetical protein